MCLANIIHTEEVEPSEIEGIVGRPDFVSEAKAHVRFVVNRMSDAFKRNNLHVAMSDETEQAVKDKLVNAFWPHFTTQALLNLHGVKGEHVNHDNAPFVIEAQDDIFFDELADISETYYEIILDLTDHSEHTLPRDLLMDIVEQGHKEQWIEDEKPFLEWFPVALHEALHQREQKQDSTFEPPPDDGFILY